MLLARSHKSKWILLAVDCGYAKPDHHAYDRAIAIDPIFGSGIAIMPPAPEYPTSEHAVF
jgi:hypothetical protein